MEILILQETDWINRGPHIQHHIFERLSRNPKIRITVLDYDIEHESQSKSIWHTRKEWNRLHKTIKDDEVKIMRTGFLDIPFVRRVSSLITNTFEILKLIRRQKPALIVSYSLSNGLIGWFFAKLFRIPFLFYYIDILHELIPVPFVRPIARIATQFLLQHSEQIIVLNEIHRKFVLQERAPMSKIEIIRTGISLENTISDSEKVQKLRELYNISPKDFVLFFMGYLYDFAGLKEIIDHYNSKVQANMLQLRFLIVGDGGIYSELKEYIKKERIEWVILTGRVSYFELANYIELANLCLLSFQVNKITREISPIKIYEYMAQKKASLSTKLFGIYSEIGENNGVIFKKTQNQLIEHIEELVDQQDLLNETGLKGYDFVCKNLLWENIMTDFKAILFKTISGKTRK